MKKEKIRFDIITAFPEAFSYLDSSLIKRAKEKKLISVKIWNLRDFTKDKHKTVDDKPYGGGPGMVLKVEPLYKAIQQIKKEKGKKKNAAKVILTDAAGLQFTQDLARKLSKAKQIIIVCGHYEGVDERVKKFVDMKISIGPYVLTGGELPAMIIIDAVSRHIEGVLGNTESLEEYRLQHSGPVYTRPEVFIDKKGKKYKVPKILLSGDHKKIKEWRKEKAPYLIKDAL